VLGILVLPLLLGASDDLPTKARLDFEQRQKVLDALNDYVKVCEDVGNKYVWAQPMAQPFEVCLDKGFALVEDTETYTAALHAIRKGLVRLYQKTAEKVLPRMREAARAGKRDPPTETWIAGSLDRTHQATGALPTQILSLMEKRLATPPQPKPEDLTRGP